LGLRAWWISGLMVRSENMARMLNFFNGYDGFLERAKVK
jgi:hypothetical protein